MLLTPSLSLHRAPAAVVALALLAVLAAPQALAAGTTAGTPVTNSVSLDYTVNGGAQPTLTDDITFLVDRRLALDVTTADADYVTVTIGQSYAGGGGVPALNYTLLNSSNEATDVVVGVMDQSGTLISDFSSSPGGSGFSAASLIVAVDDGTTDPDNRRYDSDDTVLTPNASGIYELNLAEDETINLMVVIDVPAAGVAADDFATYTLVAAAASAPGVAYDADDSGNLAPNSGAAANDEADVLGSVQTVFADTGSSETEDRQFDFFAATPAGIAGSTDAESDGQNADTSGFVIGTAGLLLAKHVEVIYDPLNGNRYDGTGALATPAVNPKAIPGAVLMYVIGIANDDSLFTADGVAVLDDLPDNGTDPEPVDEGNPLGSAVNVPVAATVEFGAAPGDDPRVFDLSSVSDLDSIHLVPCSGATTDLPFSGASVGPDTAVNEVDVGIGACGPSEQAHVVYFVTVETN